MFECSSHKLFLCNFCEINFMVCMAVSWSSKKKGFLSSTCLTCCYRTRTGNSLRWLIGSQFENIRAHQLENFLIHIIDGRAINPTSSVESCIYSSLHVKISLGNFLFFYYFIRDTRVNLKASGRAFDAMQRTKLPVCGRPG